LEVSYSQDAWKAESPGKLETAINSLLDCRRNRNVTGEKKLRGLTVRIQLIVVSRRIMWFSVMNNKLNIHFSIMQAFLSENFAFNFKTFVTSLNVFSRVFCISTMELTAAKM
jgi:hypothetical protein